MSELFINPEILKDEIADGGIETFFYCRTEEERHAFLDAMDSLGYIWNSGHKLDEFNSKAYLSPLGYRIHCNDMHISYYKDEEKHYGAVLVSDLIEGEPPITNDNLLEILGC